MAYQFAAIKPKAGEELSLVDYMDESALMVKAPLKTVNEQLRVLVSNPDLFTKDALTNASDTLEAVLATWENLDEAFKEDRTKKKGLSDD